MDSIGTLHLWRARLGYHQVKIQHRTYGLYWIRSRLAGKLRSHLVTVEQKNGHMSVCLTFMREPGFWVLCIQITLPFTMNLIILAYIFIVKIIFFTSGALPWHLTQPGGQHIPEEKSVWCVSHQVSVPSHDSNLVYFIAIVWLQHDLGICGQISYNCLGKKNNKSQVISLWLTICGH